MSARQGARNWLLLSSLGGFLILGLGFLSRCFSPQLGDCAYVCYQNDGGAPLCPEQYECRSDGYCHLLGSTMVCPYTIDLGPAPDGPPADLLPPPADGSAGDLAHPSSDGFTGDLAQMPPIGDLAQPPSDLGL